MNKVEFLRGFNRPCITQTVPDYPLVMQGTPAAVLLPLVEREELSVLFTQRAAHLRHHAGQISFPGGKSEPQDHDLANTALREAEEEIGLAPEHVEILGQLKEYRTFTGFAVTPVIGLISPQASFTADKGEVADMFEVPLSYLMDSENHLVYPFTRKHYSANVYFIPWQDTFIWGATAAFIRNLSLQLN